MSDGNIAIIGPRKSGKTTYLAALAYHSSHSASRKRSVKYTIIPRGPESNKLKDDAESVLLQRNDFKATLIGEKTVFEFPFYAFSIEYKTHLFSSVNKVEITTRDYPGEVFRKLEKSSSLDSKHEEFVHDCFKAKIGCVVLLSGWERGEDNKYYKMLKNFTTLMDKSDVKDGYKLAIVMSKCERGEIWPGRLDPEQDLFHIHLRKTKDFLREKMNSKNLRFFAMSTFGILGDKNPRPNREDRIVKGEPASVLQNPGKWKPYNLIEPIIWISETSK